jgi:hypothetical protein
VTGRWLVAVLLVMARLGGATEPAPLAPATYDEIAPILERRCVACHRAGGGAPMALDTYQRVRPWGAAMEREVIAGAMPPWHADPSYGRFQNDRSLRPGERELLLGWLREGMLRGESASASPGTASATTGCRSAIDCGTSAGTTAAEASAGWLIGTPDAVIELPEVAVPASGELPYHSYSVEAPFDRDVWVTAAETRPGNSAVVHHIIVELAATAASSPGDDPRTVGSLGGYVPGDGPLVMAPGLARLVPRGARIFFQVHYTPNGEATTDRSSLALRLAKDPPRHEARTGIVTTPFLHIPAGAAETSAEASWTFPRDAMLLSLRPHLHLRGRSFEYRARHLDGTEEILLRVPRWDFDWQTTYVLAEPKAMPAGTELRCVATWDNSPANPDNPDATQDVSWGERTRDEMMIGFFDYYFVVAGA